MNTINQKTRNPDKIIAVLLKISEAASDTRDLDELFPVIHQTLGEILNVNNFYIALLDREKDVLSFPYYVDEKRDPPGKIHHFSQTRTSTGQVIQDRQPKIFYRQDIHRLSADDLPGISSHVWMGVPLIIRDVVKGAMVIQSYAAKAEYTSSDLELLNSVSRHIALAIERKEADESLRDQRRILEKILESSPVGIALVENRVFKWVNAEMVRMFGYESKAALENASTRVIYENENDYALTGKIIDKSLSKKGCADYEYTLIRKDKTPFPAHIRLNCGDMADPMAWTIATFTDISLRKAAEKETREKERLQGVLEMAGAVCHEINQPLQAIMGYAELLLMEVDAMAVDPQGIIAIKRQAARLGEITQKLSRITCYRTVEYPGKTRIVDIWSAGSDTET